MNRRRNLLLAACIASLAVGACGWDPSHPFDRDAPAVKRALAELDAGDATAATSTLEEYLSTGACDEGKIGTPDILKKRPNGAFDLGLTLFRIGEAFGRRFGDEETEGPTPGASGPQKEDDTERQLRAAQIECALRVVRAVNEGAPLSPGARSDDMQQLELRSRARYLEGNLLFLGGRYEEAVAAYDESLRLSPGMSDAGDPVGRDAAWNRAVALRRIEDKKDAGQDASHDSSPDGSGDSGSGNDASKDSGNDSGSDKPDAGKDSGGDKGDSGKNDTPDAGGGNDASPPPPQQDEDAAPPPPPKASQDERMLDQLENAPTVQQESAKKAAQRRRVRGMQDK